MVTDSNSTLGFTKEYLKNPIAFVEKWTILLGPVFRVHLFGKVSLYILSKPLIPFTLKDTYCSRKQLFRVPMFKKFYAVVTFASSKRQEM